jgi:hypothetical protein
MNRVSAYGISAAIPEGWEARIYRHADGEPTLHAATFPLPHSDGEFGARATHRMPPRGLFLSLTEYRTGDGIDLRHGLFANPVPRSLDPAHLSTRALQQARPGQSGIQRFFSTSGRAFCLYVVVHDTDHFKRRLAAAASRVLRSLEISKTA